MTGLYEKWKSLSNNIRSLAECHSLVERHNLKAISFLENSLLEIITEVNKLADNPSEVSYEKPFFGQLKRLRDSSKLQEYKKGAIDIPDPTKIDIAKDMLIRLSILNTRMLYLLNDKHAQQIRLCKAVEVAFAHLQRQIAVDVCIGEKNKYLCLEDKCFCTGNKWWKAFNEGERACEKLGAVHLLSHKIWAFKARSVRAETDLVLQTLDFLESLNDVKNNPLYQSVNGKVITEWKKIENPKKLENEVEQAKQQIKQYIEGPLYPEDFTNCYYLIMVSEKYLDIPNILQEPNYRIINIACKPGYPSDRPARQAS